MGSKYTTIASSGYNASPPADDGSQVAANLVKWATHKSKLSDPIKTMADAINTALVTAMDYSARQVTGNESVALTDHMRTIEIAPTVSAAVTVTLADAATMTNNFIVRVKNSSTISQTIARATGGDTIDGVAGSITILSKESLTFQVNTGATGYLILSRASSTVTGTGSAVMSTSPTFATSVIGSATMAVFNSASTTVNAFGAATTLNVGNAGGTNTILGASTFSQALTAAAGITLSGTAANVALGANFISNGGTDAGFSLDASNNATLSGALAITGALTGVTTITATGIATITANTSSALLALRNSTDGATKYGRMSLGNDSAAAALDMYSFATSYTPSAWEKPLGAAVITAASQTGGLTIGAAGGDVRLFAGGLVAPIATLTSTGLNSTVIGATTAAAGSFTTLAASGVVSSTNVQQSNSANNVTTGFNVRLGNIYLRQRDSTVGIDGVTTFPEQIIGDSIPLDIYTIGNYALNLGVNSTSIAKLSSTGLSVAGIIEGVEQTAPSAPAANGYRIFAQDNGAGKTQLMVIFSSGAAQQLAIQP